MATAPPPPFDTLTTEDWSAVYRAAWRARRALDAATVEGRFANPTTETVMLANGHAEVGADERGAWIELHRRRLREGHWPSAGRLSRRNPGPAKGHLTRKTTMTTRRKSTKKPARKNGKRPVRKANGRFARKARPNRTRKAARKPSARRNPRYTLRRARRNPLVACARPSKYQGARMHWNGDDWVIEGCDSTVYEKSGGPGMFAARKAGAKRRTAVAKRAVYEASYRSRKSRSGAVKLASRRRRSR